MTAVDDGDVWFAPARLQEGRDALARASTDLGEWSVWRADSSRSSCACSISSSLGLSMRTLLMDMVEDLWRCRRGLARGLAQTA